MKVPLRERRYGLTFNITPLIDIIFLLIIFFLVASHLASSEASDPVNLPEATQSDESPDRPPRRFVVTVQAEGTMKVAGNQIDLIALDQLLLAQQSDDDRPFEVIVRGDRDVPFSKIEPIMLTCARLGIKQVDWAVIHK